MERSNLASGRAVRARGIRRARGVGLLWIALALFGCFDEAGGPEPSAASREPAPDFDLPLLSGGHVELASQRGKIVLLDFWATWCAPCEVQMPVLDALWETVDRDELMIVGVSVDTDPPSEVEAWVAERGLRYPIAIGDQRLARQFGVIGFPSLILIDREGRIHTRHTGVWSRPEIEEVLERLRSEPAPESSPSTAAVLRAPASPDATSAA